MSPYKFNIPATFKVPAPKILDLTTVGDVPVIFISAPELLYIVSLSPNVEEETFIVPVLYIALPLVAVLPVNDVPDISNVPVLYIAPPFLAVFAVNTESSIVILPAL